MYNKIFKKYKTQFSYHFCFFLFFFCNKSNFPVSIANIFTLHIFNILYCLHTHNTHTYTLQPIPPFFFLYIILFSVQRSILYEKSAKKKKSFRFFCVYVFFYISFFVASPQFIFYILCTYFYMYLCVRYMYFTLARIEEMCIVCVTA